MVRDGKRVVLGYAYKHDPRALLDSDLLWPAVQHLWANTDQLGQLESYMRNRLCGDGDAANQAQTRRLRGSPPPYGVAATPPPIIELRSMMAELTPTFEGIIFQKYHGLRELAAEINQHYDAWFRRRYWRCTNIVSADFFLGSDLVPIAIDVNRRRFSSAEGTYNSTALVQSTA
mgnify:CR=1 FL=1